MATKQFKLTTNGVVLLDLKVSGDSELVDDFVKHTLRGSFGVFDKLKPLVVTLAENKLKGDK